MMANGGFPRSHAPRGNVRPDALRPHASIEDARSLNPCVRTLRVGTRGMCLLLLAASCFQPIAVRAAGDADSQEQAAFDAAVNRVAPSVVQIETVGGEERVAGMLFGTGPTTGLIVDPRGYIVSSAFNFLNKPASILVRLPDGQRKSAKLVATDRSRMIVLLKIDAEKPLPVCKIASQREMRVGQWAIAVGRTFESERPNMAVGILSAVERIWGKALQTDAAVSPNNYGGPLADVRGRVMGILVPLSPNAEGGVAGTEWYDSGIGFAIPMEHIRQVLPRLERGEDLHSGVAGLHLKGPNLYSGPAVIAACHPKCPATAAGIKAGDQIVEIDGRPVVRGVDVKTAIGRHYAGDKMRLTVLRGKERFEREMTLVEKLEPFQHGFLGILPMRGAKENGVTVRYVYPKSPAATAGIAIGDTLVALNGKPVLGRIEMIEKIGATEPGTSVEIEVRRSELVRKLKVALSSLPESLPPSELPPATVVGKKTEAVAPRVGVVSMKTPEYPNEVFGYVPDVPASGAPRGVVVWLHGRGGFDRKQLLANWKPLCDRYGLILVAPKSSNLAGWMLTDAALIDRLLTDVDTKYHVDPTRVVVHGYESGGSLAFYSAFNKPGLIRAVAAVEATPMTPPPENEPLHRLAVYVATAARSPSATMLGLAVTAMRREKFPVVVKKLGTTPRYLNAAELAELARWIDTLDRI
jgi:serine protease Do